MALLENDRRPLRLEQRGCGRGVQKAGARQGRATRGLTGHSKEFGFILSIVRRKLLKPTSDIIKIVV